MDKQCNDCISATYPFHASKHPRKRWCSKISEFVCLDGICEFYAERKLTKQTTTETKPQQLELNLKGGD